ncbi:sensor histidine kinase [Paenibacillus sp. y28]|uniref:sensor histidine kinase n=1 Tax=Paenibacillus sp. y28 TaxID=3129110 RepID=UPI00301A66D8
MKLSYWLMLAFLVVMLLPAVAIYAYYLLLSHLDQRQDVREYMTFANMTSQIELALQKPSLYDIQPAHQYEAVRELASDSTKITLYRYDGMMLFSSTSEAAPPSLLRVNQELLYKHLYELQKNHRTYSLKSPVFSGSKLVGFYEIVVAREQWLQGVAQRTRWITILLAAFFLLLYGAVIYFIHRKFTRPLRQLMEQMTSFAYNRPAKPMNHRARDEIGALIAHFMQMRTQIIQSRETIQAEQQEKEYMVAALSHDLKTPLTVIRAYAELLEQQDSARDQARLRYYAILFEKTDYMKQLLDDLSVYTVLRSTYHVMERVEVDGDELFDMLLSGYDELCVQNGIKLQKACTVEGVFEVHVSQVVRVVDNLMNNAIRHTPVGGRIGIAAVSAPSPYPDWVFPPFQEQLAAWHESGVVLLVQNEGEDIPAAMQEKVFEPFYQKDAARTQAKTGQSGLGLSIAKLIIDKHEGQMRLWSAPGYGTLIACQLQQKG